jgi:hypothetical protein
MAPKKAFFPHWAAFRSCGLGLDAERQCEDKVDIGGLGASVLNKQRKRDGGCG